MRMFQSAPHFSSEANIAVQSVMPCSWWVSIRASLQQRGERVEPAESAERNSFNPRLTSAARRTDGAGRALFGRLFQSAPHFSSEANVRVAQIIEFAMLFQSAPHFSSEANDRSLLATGADGQFQSAPHFSSEANRAGGFILAERDSVFQSAPHFSSEANVLLVNVSVPASVFQSAPHFSSEAN